MKTVTRLSPTRFFTSNGRPFVQKSCSNSAVHNKFLAPFASEYAANCQRGKKKGYSKSFPTISYETRRFFSKGKGDYTDSNHEERSDHAMFEEQMLELKQEREALFGFSDEERASWSRASDSKSYEAVTFSNDGIASGDDGGCRHTIPGSLMEEIHRARELHFAKEDHIKFQDATIAGGKNDQPFTHLTPEGDSVNMVDVGNKDVTKRTALARSSVVFPPEVMDAFQVTNEGSEMVGPKGPIFTTAKLAGIMASKRTAELIPLCHPLPLDKVEINIRLSGNSAIIECECKVTHKTGVEMEALTGATVAALTIYDMVKAISHRVRIQSTELVTKSGGKREIKNGTYTDISTEL